MKSPFEVLQPAPWRRRCPAAPQRFLDEAFRQPVLVVTRGRVLLVPPPSGHWDVTSKWIYWCAKEIAGALEVERDGGSSLQQALSPTVQSLGCEN